MTPHEIRVVNHTRLSRWKAHLEAQRCTALVLIGVPHDDPEGIPLVVTVEGLDLIELAALLHEAAELITPEEDI